MKSEAVNPLASGDIERLVSLVARAGDPAIDVPLAERRWRLLRDVAQLVDANVCLWTVRTDDPAPSGPATTIAWLDRCDGDASQLLLTNPAVSSAAELPIVALPQSFDGIATKLGADDDGWQQFGPVWQRGGSEHLVLVVSPLNSDEYSCAVLRRPAEFPAFTARERAIAQVVFRQVAWLHRDECQPAPSPKVELTPRERETLELLLGGDTKRQIGAKLGISEHTVGDYTKRVYKCFQVRSRSELRALLMNVQTNERDAPASRVLNNQESRPPP